MTTHDPDAPRTVQVLVIPPTCGDAVTIYEVGIPPEFAALTVTVACAYPAIAVGIPGTPGAELEICCVDSDVAVVELGTPLTVLVPTTIDLMNLSTSFDVAT